MAREARRRKTKRRTLQIGIGIPVAIGLVFLLVKLFSNDNGAKKSASDVGATTTIAGSQGSSDIATTTPASSDIAATTTTPGAAPLPCPSTDGSSTKTTTFPAAPS